MTYIRVHVYFKIAKFGMAHFQIDALTANVQVRQSASYSVRNCEEVHRSQKISDISIIIAFYYKLEENYVQSMYFLSNICLCERVLITVKVIIIVKFRFISYVITIYLFLSFLIQILFWRFTQFPRAPQGDVGKVPSITSIS